MDYKVPVTARRGSASTSVTMRSLTWTSLFALLGTVRAQTGVTDPIYENCGPSVVCINHYANVLP